MKNIINYKIFLLLFLIQNLKVNGQINNSKYKVYLGSSTIFNNKDKTALFFQTGIKYDSPNSGFFIGLDNNFYFRNAKYNWPDVGSYNYKKIINVSSFYLGTNLIENNFHSLGIGISGYLNIFSGKLKTQNDLIKNYILNDYFILKYNISPMLYYSFNLNYKSSIKFNYIHFNGGKNLKFNGIGVSYVYNFN